MVESPSVQFYKLTPETDASETEYGPTLSIGNVTLYASMQEYVDSHYFTVTGLVEDSVTNSVYPRLSSWGLEYYVVLDDYLEAIDGNTGKLVSGYIEVDRI